MNTKHMISFPFVFIPCHTQCWPFKLVIAVLTLTSTPTFSRFRSAQVTEQCCSLTYTLPPTPLVAPLFHLGSACAWTTGRFVIGLNHILVYDFRFSGLLKLSSSLLVIERQDLLAMDGSSPPRKFSGFAGPL
jgi:hypothetical protein